jgi:8-oxo-dGTP diphosphatase
VDKRTDMPMVGVGVFLMRGKKCLAGRRKGSHGEGLHCLPGGHVEKDETLIQAALREVKEETGIVAEDAFILTAADAMFPEQNLHYVTVFLVVKCPKDQEPRNLEPEKKEAWNWVDPKNFPAPMMPCMPGGLERLNFFMEMV